MCKCYKIRNDLLHADRALIFIRPFSLLFCMCRVCVCVYVFAYFSISFYSFSSNALENELKIKRSAMWISC